LLDLASFNTNCLARGSSTVQNTKGLRQLIEVLPDHCELGIILVSKLLPRHWGFRN